MFGSSNTFDPNNDITDLSGKIYVVTGGSAGIGFGIVAHILQHNPAAIYLLGKKEEHIKEAENELLKWADVSKVHSVQIELEDLHQTDQVARDLASRLDRLDALVLNAGLGVGVYNETPKGGIDSHMQVNHIAQFHLAQTLLPLLQKTENSRLVCQSSDLHRECRDVQFASLQELNQDIGAMKLYSRTKLAQVLYVRGLAQLKSKGKLGFSPHGGPWINATHPGGIQTDQQKQAVDAYGTLGKIGVAAVKPLLGDPVNQGCKPALFAATSEDIVKHQVQGEYIVPDRKVADPSTQAKDDVLQQNLWKLTEQILKDKLGDLPYETVYA